MPWSGRGASVVRAQVVNTERVGVIGMQGEGETLGRLDVVGYVGNIISRERAGDGRVRAGLQANDPGDGED